jgi:3',5'-cyclic AMP phosphodiesterase CpdA
MAYVDKFPFETESAEAIMQQSFVAPLNGPDSEDGNMYDKSRNTKDFPSYKENVFYYTHDNVAMIVLNSSYWYSSNAAAETATSGGLLGYIQDNQLKWLQQIIQKIEKNKAIDHIFVTLHAPVFPNGGHVSDGMWYNGDNEKRPYISGNPVDKGIIERRDEFLDILINQSKKVVAVLAGHEHSYNRLELTKEVNIYPDNYPFKKLNISRPIFQIINGAAGAPYYTQEKTPWSEQTKAFTIENALCLFYVDGKTIKMKVVNPDTLNEIDEIKLR